MNESRHWAPARAGSETIGAGALASGHEALALELGDGAADGDAAHGVLGHQLRFRGEEIARAVHAALDAITQLTPELLVQRWSRLGSDQLLQHADTL